MTVDSKIILSIQSIFKGEGFTKATQATKNMSKDIKDAGGAVKDLAGSMGQLGGEVGKAAGGLSKLMGLMGAGPLGLLVAGVTAIVGAFIKWRDTMREVEDKMNALSRSKHEDMWARMHKRIADAAKAQSEFFDEAIQKGQRILAFAKAEQKARSDVKTSEYNKEVARYEGNQAAADAELAMKKRQNLETLPRTEAEYQNKQLDLDNQKQHIDTERRVAGELHKAKMEQLRGDLDMLEKEKAQLEKDAQALYEKDAAERKNAQTRKKGLEKEARDLEQDPEYRQWKRRTARREEKQYDSSPSADKRQRYWDDLHKIQDWEKKIRDTREKELEVDKEYQRSQKEVQKREEEIASKHKVIQMEIEALSNQISIQRKSFETKNKQLDAKYHDVWAKITEASKEETARKAMKQLDAAIRQMQLKAKEDAKAYKNPEFQALVMAQSKVAQLEKRLNVLETTVDPHDKQGRSIKDSNPDEYNKVKDQWKEAFADLQEAHRSATQRRNDLWKGGWDIMNRFEQSEINRSYQELERLAQKMAEQGSKNDGRSQLSKEYQQQTRELKSIEKSIMAMNALRTKKADDGLEKQAAIENELHFIHQIADRTRAAIDQIESNTRRREAGQLTGEGRAAARNAAKEERVENARLNRRIAQQEKAAQRDAQRGWGLDRDGNLVKTRRNAETLSRRQQDRLREYLQRRRLEKEGKALDKKAGDIQDTWGKNVKMMSSTLIKVRGDLAAIDQHIQDALTAK